MGDRGATGGAWGARDDASWWPGNAGELQHPQQLNEDVVRSTASATHQLFTYKMTGGFSNNTGDNSAGNYDYRIVSSSNNREEPQQQQWWYAGSVDSHQQTSSPTPQSQPSPDPEQEEQGNGTSQNQNLQQQQDQSQAIQQQNQLQQLQQQNLQQVLQQQNHLQQNLQQEQQTHQQQTLQQMLQQHQQQQQSLQQTLQVSQAQAQAIAQAALQQQVAQSLQHQQKSLHDQIQAVQQQQIQAALQRQSATLQELQQQGQQQALTPRARMPRARADNKPRGRMTAYAFFVQNFREELKQQHPDESVVFAAFSKKCAERWSTMSEKEKARFHELAERDKRRFDLEMQSYVPPKDAKVRGRKRQQPKDPNAPKRSLSAFFLFCNDERSKVKACNPEYVMGDIAKELGRRWAAAGPEVKAKYEALSDQDKARYDREMTAYKKGPLALLQQQQQQMSSKPELEEDMSVYEGEDYN